MLPNASQTANKYSSQDQLEDSRLEQPLIQPQNTYPRFLSSTLGVFQKVYHSVIPPRLPSGPTDAETVRSYVPSSQSAKKKAKRVRVREEESPSALRLTEQTAGTSTHPFTDISPHARNPVLNLEREVFENCDTRPQKGLKEAPSTIRIEEQVASPSWSTKDRGIHDRYKSFESGESGLGAQHHRSNVLHSRRSDFCETSENCTFTAPKPMSAHITTNKVASFQGAHNFTIRDNACITNVGVSNVSNVSNYGRTFDLDIMERFMEKYVSLNATHDSPVQDPDRMCHPETRRNVLKQIHDWADDPDGKESIFWLHGPAGVGKSAIAQTIARSYNRQQVAATFFFYRSDPSRNDGNKLFTTIAWQLALLIPVIKAHIINSLNERPDLPKKDIETQFQELIVKPLQAFASASSQTHLPSLVIIVDGVDECVDEKLQKRLLKIIGNAVNDPDFLLRFLICSRSEAYIEEAIDSFQCAPLRLDLAEVDDHDIEKYLRAEFLRIASEQDLDPTWPGEEKIENCVYKSSGHFVYASTVIKIIDDEYNSAHTQLDILLGLKPHSGKSLFAELDGLYLEILKRQRDWAFLNDILSLLSCSFFRLSLPTIGRYAIFMDISEKELCRKLRGMRSLIKLDAHIDVHHRSFLDFLKDSSRSDQYHISERTAERQYLDLITASIVRYVRIAFEQPHCHEQHFSLAISFDYRSMLSVEELQQALQPLVYIQDKLLNMEKSSWLLLLRCDMCNILTTVWNLLLYLTCYQETSKQTVPHYAQAVEQSLTEHAGTIGPPTPFVVTETEQVVVEKSDLDVCLSSLLVHLRETKFPPSAMIINLMCSLLDFDYVETAMRVCSISDGQLLVDVVDYLLNNEDFLKGHSIAIARGATRLSIAIHQRVPVLPRSLFSPRDSFPFFLSNAIFYLPLFTEMFIGRILDRKYVLRVSCICKEGELQIVHDSMSTYQSIKEWRGSNPSSVTMLQVILEVAKAIQYLDSMDIMIPLNLFGLELIHLDSECHVEIFLLGTSPPFAHFSEKEWDLNRNIIVLGRTFFQIYFDVEYLGVFKENMLQELKHPSEPEISDELWQVIQRCCASDPKSRPTIDEVVQEMESWKID